MSTAPLYPSIIDEQLAGISTRPMVVLLHPDQSLPEALGLPPETRLIDTPICSPMTMRGGRRYVSVQPCARH